MSEQSLELVVPGIGQVVNLDDYRECALAIDGIRDLETDLRYVKTELSRAIAHAASVQGTKTLELEDGRKVTVGGGTETVYDAEQLEIGLREVGMPEHRIRQIVVETVAYKVNAVEAKRAAAANPVYAGLVEMCRSENEKPATVSIRRP